MKLNISDIEFDIETKLPPRYEDTVSVQRALDDWYKLWLNSKRKQKRELRLKKINDINGISQKGE
jgi:hypothetical protein